jgi:protein-tyrosine-phosphatase
MSMDRNNQLKALAERLAKLQEAVSEAEGKQLSDADFAKRYLPFSSTTFSRIKSVDDPYTGSVENMEAKVAQAEEDVASRLASVRLNAQSERGFVQTTLARAVQASIKKARDSRLRRVVVALAPTGGGKSEIGKMLATKGNIYIEGRQSWRKSYKAFCSDIARAAGRPMKKKDYCEHDAEERMIQALQSHDYVLYIDEANTLSAESVNAIKLIVNVTNSVVVIAAIPGLWDLMAANAEEEFAQLANRCQPILRSKGVSDSDVKPFLSCTGLSAAEVDKCLCTVVESANEFGALLTVKALVDELKQCDRPTSEEVMTFVKFHRKNTANAGIKKGISK